MGKYSLLFLEFDVNKLNKAGGIEKRDEEMKVEICILTFHCNTVHYLVYILLLSALWVLVYTQMDL